MLTRFGVLGDIHTEDDALRRALDALLPMGLDAILSVGDLLDGAGDPDRTCALLRDAGVIAVTGNHDRWFLQGTPLGRADDTLELHDGHRAWLASLPSSRRFETTTGGLVLCHGIGDDDMAVFREDTDHYSIRWLDALNELCADESVALMVAGHTHERMVRTIDGLTVINAGTLHRSYAPGFVVVDLEGRRVRAFDLFDHEVLEAETLDF